MNLLAFYLGSHDSNLCAFDDGEFKYAKAERISGVKHHHATLDFISKTCDEWHIKTPDAVAFSDGNRNDLGTCGRDELYKEVEPLFGAGRTFCLDHHYAHILSAWPVTPLSDAAGGIAIDGLGDCGLCARVILRPGSRDPELIYSSSDYTFGALFYKIGLHLNLSGPSMDFAGKLMGLQAMGTPDMDYVASISINPTEGNILRWITDIPFRGLPPAQTDGFFRTDNSAFLDWLASVHLAIERRTLAFFKTFFESHQAIAYSGGCAQNVIVNASLAEAFPELKIPPHCYDGGISIGCIEFLRLFFDQPAFTVDKFPFWQTGGNAMTPLPNTIDRVADLLARGAIVGWFYGNGEIGPRALGHRSLLVDPRQKDAPDLLNRRIKKREPWRPFGASVLLNEAPQWFDIKSDSPYMLRSMRAKAERTSAIPAVVHIDGTCRIQTVSESDESLQAFHYLLCRFSNRTGIPMLLNTSLNGPGAPIVNSAVQAKELFAAGAIDALCLGDDLYVKKGEAT
jgi:carbamoyltransferase